MKKLESLNHDKFRLDSKSQSRIQGGDHRIAPDDHKEASVEYSVTVVGGEKLSDEKVTDWCTFLDKPVY
ncbi:MAG: hypothetical protein WBA74_12140 [Cyclobacteriaceae bacterium]